MSHFEVNFAGLLLAQAYSRWSSFSVHSINILVKQSRDSFKFLSKRIFFMAVTAPAAVNSKAKGNSFRVENWQNANSLAISKVCEFIKIIFVGCGRWPWSKFECVRSWHNWIQISDDSTAQPRGDNF